MGVEILSRVLNLLSSVKLQRKNVAFPGPEVIKHFSCSTQLSMEFKLLINIEITRINGIFRFQSSKPVIYPKEY